MQKFQANTGGYFFGAGKIPFPQVALFLPVREKNTRSHLSRQSTESPGILAKNNSSVADSVGTPQEFAREIRQRQFLYCFAVRFSIAPPPRATVAPVLSGRRCDF
jgi:hypothetical protein